MEHIPSVNLYFDDYSESFYLIRFGKKEHLEKIQNGIIRFTNFKKYQIIEDNNIGDIYEGLSSIHYTDKNTKIYFSHPNINNNSKIDYTESIKSMWNYPDLNIFISCFSYFTAKDIHDNNIFDDSILSKEDWNYVLLVLDTKSFVENIFNSIKIFNPFIKKVKYYDYSKNQENLDIFTKSLKYEFQKEIRFAFNMNEINCNNMKRIDEYIVEISFEKVQCVIIPTNEFKKGFYFKG